MVIGRSRWGSWVVLAALGLMAFGGCGDTKSDDGASAGRGGGLPSGGTRAGAAPAGSGGAGGAAAGSGGAGAGSGGQAGSALSGSGGLAGDSGSGGDASAEAGAGGEGGAPDPVDHATQVDLLLVIDSSISMFEKQGVLAQALPTLVGRLIDPFCVDSTGALTPPNGAVCPPGTAREFDPVLDMHLGVITTSLGNHGGEVCRPAPDDATTGRTPNDRAHLVGRVRSGLRSWAGSGFLKWDPLGEAGPPGEDDAAVFTADLTAMIAAVGDNGCGYEAPLEAMYRFLVDPEPPLEVTNDGTFTVVTGVDSELLAQRASFLRPESVVVVVLLSDEDDCSILDEPGQQGWLTGRTAARMPRASASCEAPNDPCCRPCVSPAAAGCPSDAEDAACSLGLTLTAAEDSTNLRCYRQRQRFGIDLLYPLERYVDGITSSTIRTRSGTLVDNPLFASGRTPNLVLLTSIVGVPWQDLARDPSASSDLSLMTAAELERDGRFAMILGDVANGVRPSDPFMQDSIAARSGTNPVTGQPILPSDTMSATSTINGHEQVVVGGDDLQYACIFPLPEPIPCDTLNEDDCDCNESELAYSRPICRDPASGALGTTQYFAKAYPGLRQLEVTRRLDERGVFASICPKDLSDPNRRDYGYLPAMRALQPVVAERLRP